MANVVATLALLKVYWDSEHRDYIDTFVPFVVTLLNKHNYDGIEVNQICTDFRRDFGLSIPYHPMITILNRVRLEGYIRRQRNGLFITVKEKIAEGSFANIAAEQIRRQVSLTKHLVAYARYKHDEEMSEAEAEASLIDFLRAHDLDILFAAYEISSTLPEVEVSKVQKYIVRSFIVNAYESEPAIFDFISDMSIGHVMANSVLLEEPESFRGALGQCKFYLDVGFLFSILGVNGPEKEKAYKELLNSLISLGAKVLIFQHTYQELLGILDNCLQWVESDSYDPLRASRASQYFRDLRYTSSDVEMFIISVYKRLVESGITITKAVERVSRYQIDEKKLHEAIVSEYSSGNSRFDEFAKEFTIEQDVKSISAMHQLRKGWKPAKIQDAQHVFVTTNTTLAFVSRRFEIENEHYAESTIPTVLTDILVGTLVWIRMPAKAQDIGTKQLIANCYAALQPSHEILRKLVDAAERLAEAGRVTEEEVVLLKESRVARNLLQEKTLGDPDRFSDKTVDIIMDEMKDRIRQDEQQAFQEERARHRAERQELEKRLSRADEQRIAEEQQRIAEEQQRQQIEEHNKALAQKIARGVASALLFVLVPVILIITIVSVFPEWFIERPLLRYILMILAVILSAASLITGCHLLGIKKSVEAKLRDLFRTILLPGDKTTR
jgi:hypothetical protein